jgi:thiamine pyrophosphokinase
MNIVNNIVDMTIFDSNEKKYKYTILIILNRPICKELFILLKDKVDHIICADGGANRMYDDLGEDR